jgi:hypothetical protein
MALDDASQRYLASQSHGRLATMGSDGHHRRGGNGARQLGSLRGGRREPGGQHPAAGRWAHPVVASDDHEGRHGDVFPGVAAGHSEVRVRPRSIARRAGEAAERHEVPGHLHVLGTGVVGRDQPGEGVEGLGCEVTAEQPGR